MKKILFIALTALSTGAMAQVSSGNIFLIGSGNINSSGGESTSKFGGTSVTTESPKQFRGNFNIGGGYFLTDNIAAGLTIGLSGNKVTVNDTNYTKSNSFNVGVFGRYYLEMSSNFYFHGGLYLGMSTGSSSSTVGNTTNDGPKLSSFGFGIRPGFTFFPNERFGFDMTVGNLGYTMAKSSDEVGPVTTETKNNSFNLGFDLTTVNFGIQYFLGR